MVISSNKKQQFWSQIIWSYFQFFGPYRILSANSLVFFGLHWSTSVYICLSRSRLGYLWLSVRTVVLFFVQHLLQLFFYLGLFWSISGFLWLSRSFLGSLGHSCTFYPAILMFDYLWFYLTIFIYISDCVFLSLLSQTLTLVYSCPFLDFLFASMYSRKFCPGFQKNPKVSKTPGGK